MTEATIDRRIKELGSSLLSKGKIYANEQELVELAAILKSQPTLPETSRNLLEQICQTLNSGLTHSVLNSLNGSRFGVVTSLKHLESILQPEQSKGDVQLDYLKNVLEGSFEKNYSKRLEYAIEAVGKINKDIAKLRNTDPAAAEKKALHLAELVYDQIGNNKYLKSKCRSDILLQERVDKLQRDALQHVSGLHNHRLVGDIIEGNYDPLCSKASRRRLAERYNRAKIIIESGKRLEDYQGDYSTLDTERVQELYPQTRVKSIAEMLSEDQIKELVHEKRFLGFTEPTCRYIRSLLENFCDIETLKDYLRVNNPGESEIPQMGFIAKLEFGKKAQDELIAMLESSGKVRKASRQAVNDFYEQRHSQNEPGLLYILTSAKKDSVLHQMGHGDIVRGVNNLIAIYGKEDGLKLAVAASRFRKAEEVLEYIDNLGKLDKANMNLRLFNPSRNNPLVRLGHGLVGSGYRNHPVLESIDESALKNFKERLSPAPKNEVYQHTVTYHSLRRKAKIKKGDAVDTRVANSLLNQLGSGDARRAYYKILDDFGDETGNYLSLAASRFTNLRDMNSYLDELRQSQDELNRHYGPESHSKLMADTLFSDAIRFEDMCLVKPGGIASRYEKNPEPVSRDAQKLFSEYLREKTVDFFPEQNEPFSFKSILKKAYEWATVYKPLSAA